MKKNLKHRIPKHRKGAWFVNIRNSYIPVSWQGWLTYIPFVVALIAILDAGYKNLITANLDDLSILQRIWTAITYTAINIVPGFVAVGALMTWLAIKKS
jgi:hypothetical protein